MPGPKENRPSGSSDNLLEYFKQHSRETISYILLILGIVLLFFHPLYGGLLVGIVAGIYFGDEIVDYIKKWKGKTEGRIDYKELARHLICAGLALAFFISAPAIFLGAAISIGIKQLFVGQS